MSAQCQGCGARSLNAYLCGNCQDELREVLTELALGSRIYIGDGVDCTSIPTDKRGPSLLRYLHDARLGFTRLGESERRSNENSRPALARLSADPETKDSFKGTPLELSNEIHQTLSYWASVISTTTEALGKP
jgi:hypothetical protein